MTNPNLEQPAAYDCVLIDDEELVRATWRLAARSAGVRLLAVAASEDFWGHAPQLNLTVPIYVDCNLANQTSGERLADQICAAGFTNIYLQTGYDRDAVGTAARPWLKGLVGKEPPWP